MVGATEQTQTSVRFKQQAETLYIFEFIIPGAHAFYSSTSEIYALILFKRPMDDAGCGSNITSVSFTIVNLGRLPELISGIVC